MYVAGAAAAATPGSAGSAANSGSSRGTQRRSWSCATTVDAVVSVDAVAILLSYCTAWRIRVQSCSHNNH
jgi:hypothetical protein